jgi:hypothetical protein
MLYSTLTPDGAMPKLLLKHRSLYKWITYIRVCVYSSGESRGVFIESMGRFLDLVATIP